MRNISTRLIKPINLLAGFFDFAFLLRAAIQIPLDKMAGGEAPRQTKLIPWSATAGAGSMAVAIFLIHIILPREEPL